MSAERKSTLSAGSGAAEAAGRDGSETPVGLAVGGLSAGLSAAQVRDVVVTVPADIWPDWIAEGDPAGAEWSGTEWVFTVPTVPKRIRPGDRVYVVAAGRLRGYAPLTRVDVLVELHTSRPVLVRRGGAVPVTIERECKGFQGFRYRWWPREDEAPFPLWREPTSRHLRFALKRRLDPLPAPTGEDYRASGGVMCRACGCEYRLHPMDPDVLSDQNEPFLNVLCSGDRVKL